MEEDMRGNGFSGYRGVVRNQIQERNNNPNSLSLPIRTEKPKTTCIRSRRFYSGEGSSSSSSGPEPLSVPTTNESDNGTINSVDQVQQQPQSSRFAFLLPPQRLTEPNEPGPDSSSRTSSRGEMYRHVDPSSRPAPRREMFRHPDSSSSSISRSRAELYRQLNSSSSSSLRREIYSQAESGSGSSSSSGSRGEMYRHAGLPDFSQVLMSLEMMDHEEDIDFEHWATMETNYLLGTLGLRDEYRDMRMDIDDMSYEDLLALEESIGSVSTALPEDQFAKCLQTSVYRRSTMVTGKCCICQEEFEEEEKVGKLKCKHSFHVDCVREWLHHKNWCPVCKGSLDSK